MIDPINLYGLHPMHLFAYPFYWFFRLKLWVRGIEATVASEYTDKMIHLQAAAGSVHARAELAWRYLRHLPESAKEAIGNDYVTGKFAAAHAQGQARVVAENRAGAIIPGPGFVGALGTIEPQRSP